MKVSLAWLQEYTDLPGSVDALTTLLDGAGLTVEASHRVGADFPQVVIAQILESTPHPNADRLSVCRVEDGSGVPRQIVCGAKNYKVGDRVPLALPGAVLPGDFKIKVGRLRGVESQGMLCSGRELGLAEEAAGLLILPSDAPVGKPLSALFPPDTVLDLEVTPNRPDCLGHLGVAREIHAFTRGPFREPTTGALPHAAKDAPAVSDFSACPLYSLRRITGVKNGASPGGMAARLEAVGLRAINAIVDVTNHVLMEFSQPLHAFDAARIHGSLQVRFAAAGERLLALDGREYALEPTDLVIADDSGPVALAGIMGGERSGVGPETTEILLESALFHPALIRRTARRLDLRTESGYRFERGVNPQAVLTASQRACDLILKICGGTAAPEIQLAGAVPAAPSPVRLRPERCRALLGANLSDLAMTEALEAFGLEPLAPAPHETLWKIPPHRSDLTREADLIEEVARHVGIDAIPARLVTTPTPASEVDHQHDFQHSLRTALTHLGFFEARSGSLVSDALASGCAETVRLRNPLGEDQANLRPSLLPGLLNALAANRRAGEATIRIFEIGKVFLPTAEPLRLALAVTGHAAPPSWKNASPEPADIFLMKGLAASFLPRDVTFVPAEPDHSEIARLQVLSGQTNLGWLAQLTPASGRALDAQHPVFVADFSLEALRTTTRQSEKFSDIPTFPSTTRDIALVTPKSLSYASVAAALEEMAEPLLERFAPFDVFHDPTGKRLPADKKSLAISLTFRSSQRTLTTEEVNAATDRIKERLKTALAVSFRE